MSRLVIGTNCDINCNDFAEGGTYYPKSKLLVVRYSCALGLFIQRVTMGNSGSVSAQASMLAAKAKVGGALNDIDKRLTMQPKKDEAKKNNKDWKKMHQQTEEIYAERKMETQARVSTAKARWEANRKRKEAREAKK